jgi:hypothetical protein
VLYVGSAGADVRSVSYNLDASQFLSGWREKAGRLFVPTLSDSRVGDEVAVRLGIAGHPIRATLFGKVSLVRRVGRPALPPGVEIRLESHSLAAAGFLAMAARGEAVRFTEREPRWSARRKLLARHGGIDREVETVNVSESGCALLWPGEAPPVGDELDLRLRPGPFAASVRAVVCWSEPGPGAEPSVGARVVSGWRGGRAWRSLVAQVARSGAPAA